MDTPHYLGLKYACLSYVSNVQGRSQPESAAAPASYYFPFSSAPRKKRILKPIHRLGIDNSSRYKVFKDHSI